MQNAIHTESRARERGDLTGKNRLITRDVRLNDFQFSVVLVTSILLVYVLGRFLGLWW